MKNKVGAKLNGRKVGFLRAERKRIGMCIVLLSLLSSFAVIVYASPGTLDMTFNGTGKIVTPVGNGDDVASGVAVQDDGKTVVAGAAFNGSNNDFAVVRYNPNGSLDPTFGAGGKVITAIGSAGDEASKVVIQADGKIVVAGSTFNGVNFDFALVRYNPDGSLDFTFGAGGKVVTAVGDGNDIAHDLAIQEDGRIVVAGGSFNGLRTVLATVRYNASGSLDPAFGSGGKALTDTLFNNAATAVAIQTDGKIVVSSSKTTGDIYVVARYTTNGSLDPGFGQGGVATVEVGIPVNTLNIQGARAIDVQDDGKILIAGNGRNFSGLLVSIIVRLRPDGSLDTTFGFNGIRYAFVGINFSSFFAVKEIKSRVVVAGTVALSGSGLDFVTVRYRENGQLDNSFGIGGIVTTPIANGNGNDVGLDMAIQRDGKLIVAGDTFNGANRDFAVVRYVGGISGRITRSLFDFDSDGTSDIAVFRPSDGNWYVLRSSDGSVVIEHFGLNGDLITPGDYDGDGKTDLAVFRPSEGIWYLQQSSAGFAALQWGLNGDRPVPGDYDSDGKTDIAVWRPGDGTWYILRSSGGQLILPFGLNGDVPALGDYDGDCISDIAVFRPSDGNWYVLRSSDGSVVIEHFGLNGDLITPGDYDGDGKTDLAVFRPSEGIWYLQQSSAGFAALQWGLNGDRPVPGDYDSDGKTDIAVWRPGDGTWYIIQSSNGQPAYSQFGTNADVPVPAAYIP